MAATLAIAGTPEEFAAPAAVKRLRTQAETVLRAEAPVCFDRLARTIADAWGIGRVTERVRERVRETVPGHVVELGGALWLERGDAEEFAGFRGPAGAAEAPRGPEELPLVEVGNAMEWLLRQHRALAKDDLARETARCFGITRLGSVVCSVMAEGLQQLVESGRVVADGAVVRLA